MSETDNHQIPSVRLDQSLSVLADVVATFIGATRSEKDDMDLKKLHQMSVAIFLVQLLMRSKHKEEMAQILDVIAIELREGAGVAVAPRSVSEKDLADFVQAEFIARSEAEDLARLVLSQYDVRRRP